MSAVNPMFATSDPRSDREKVAALFGQAPEVILIAVGRFLQKNPGDLDHHNLRTIASAAPHIDDPKLVAELIDRLPITKMHVGLKPIDVDAARENFRRVLPHYRVRTRVNLVSDLVHQTAVDALMFSETARLTEEAKHFLEGHLMTLASGNDEDRARAAGSEHTTSEVIDAVLDGVERTIARSERGTTNRAPGKPPLRLVSDSLGEVVRRSTRHTTNSQLERAWSLVQRCEFDSEPLMALIRSIADNPKLSDPLAHSVLDAIAVLRHLGDLRQAEPLAGLMRGTMISVPEMPESAVRRAVAEGVEASMIDGIVDPRLYLYRAYQYDPWRRDRTATVPSRVDESNRHPVGEAVGGELARRVTSAELDRWIASRSVADLSPAAVEAMTDPDALLALSKSWAMSLRWMLGAMKANPHTPKEVFSNHFARTTGLVGRISDASRIVARSLSAATRVTPDPVLMSLDRRTPKQEAIADYRLTDDDLAAIIRARPMQRRLLVGVARNPSAGPRVLEVLLERAPTDELLVRLACNTGNREVHRLLEQHVLSLESSSAGSVDLGARLDCARQLRQALADNGTVTGTLFGGTIRRGYLRPSVYAPGKETGSDGCYGPEDVARRMIDDGDASGPHLYGMVQMATGEASMQTEGLDEALDACRALLMLADADILPPKAWSVLTQCSDTHVAMRFATHPNCTSSLSSAETSAEKCIRETVEVLNSGSPLPTGRVRSWQELPNRKDVRFEIPPAIEMLDGQAVGELTLELIKSPRQLKEAANYMGNCLEGYETSASEGSVVIATAQNGPDERLAVSLNVVRGGETPLLEVREINSRFNRSSVPRDFRDGIYELTGKLSRGELQPVHNSASIETEVVDIEAQQVAVEAPSDEHDAARVEVVVVQAAGDTADSAADQTDHDPLESRRPAEQAAPRDRARLVRRGRRLELNAAPAENRAAPHDQPSLLTNQDVETEVQQVDPVIGLGDTTDLHATDLPSTDEPRLEL